MDTDLYLKTIKILWYISVSSQVILLLSMYSKWHDPDSKRLTEDYPCFVAFLAMSITFSLCLTMLGTAHPGYRVAWSITNLAKDLMLCGAIGEVFLTLRRQYPYIGDPRIATKGITVAVGLFLLTGLLQTSQLFPLSDPSYSVVCAVIFIRKYVCLAAAVLLIGAWRYFRVVAPMLTQNLRRHTLLMAAYCGSLACILWAMAAHMNQQLVNVALMVVSAALYLGWSVALRADGEERLAFLSEEQAAIALQERADFFNDVRVLFAGIRSRVRG